MPRGCDTTAKQPERQGGGKAKSADHDKSRCLTGGIARHIFRPPVTDGCVRGFVYDIVGP